VRAAVVIATKDLRQRLRDRSALTIGLIAPLAVAALMSFAFRNADTFHMNVGVVVQDRGELASAFRAGLSGPELRDLVSVHVVADPRTAAKQVRDRTLDAAFVVPVDFTRRTLAGLPAEIQVLSSTNARIAGQVASAIASSFAAQVNADRLSVATAMAAGSPSARLDALESAATQLRIPEQAVNHPTGAKQLKTISYYAPAMAIFFALFSVGFAGRSFFAERREGTLDRMAAAPLRPSTILIGKVLSVFVYSLASMLTVVGISGLFFGADWGGPTGVVALCVAMSLAIVALSALVIVFARTEQQVQALGSIIVFTLAVLGGNFITVSAEPALMRHVALLTPNGWALRGFLDLATGARSAGNLVQPVVSMLIFAVIVGGIAIVRSRRVLSP